MLLDLRISRHVAYIPSRAFPRFLRLPLLCVLEQVTIPFASLGLSRDSKPVGSGSFGVVYKGTWGDKVVAVKVSNHSPEGMRASRRS